MTTKEKLIASALKLFNEKGFEKTSTTSICTDAGFSSSALFVHFKTKNDLLDFLYIDIKKKYFEYVLNGLDDISDITERFRKLMERSFEFYLKDYQYYTFVKNFASSVHVSRVAKQEAELDLESFAAFYKEGIEKGIFIDGNFGLIGAATSGMFYNMVEYVKNNDDVSVDEAISLIMKFVLK